MDVGGKSESLEFLFPKFTVSHASPSKWNLQNCVLQSSICNTLYCKTHASETQSYHNMYLDLWYYFHGKGTFIYA